jgi:hypothetical protein
VSMLTPMLLPKSPVLGVSWVTFAPTVSGRPCPSSRDGGSDGAGRSGVVHRNARSLVLMRTAGEAQPHLERGPLRLVYRTPPGWALHTRGGGCWWLGSWYGGPPPA